MNCRRQERYKSGTLQRQVPYRRRSKERCRGRFRNFAGVTNLQKPVREERRPILERCRSQERCRGRFLVGAEARNAAEAGSETLQEPGTLQKPVLEERRPILERCRS